MIAYKYDNVCNELNGKENVFPRFAADFTNCKKRFMRINKTSIIICFITDKYSEKYILPVSCLDFIKQNERGKRYRVIHYLDNGTKETLVNVSDFMQAVNICKAYKNTFILDNYDGRTYCNNEGGK